MENKENIIGKRIETLMNKNGWNQIQFAEKLGLKASATISQYISGDRSPSDIIKLKICEICNCSMDYLTGMTNIQNYDKIKQELNDLGIDMSQYQPPTEEEKEKMKLITDAILRKKED